MRISNLFGKTLRQNPSEADTISHQLLLKAGMVHQLAAGVYSYLPLAWRSLRKIEQIIREEMDAAGSQELMMPVLQPLEMWQETGRDQAFGETLFTLQDRRQRKLVLAPTHEEVISQLVRLNARSYRDLPLILYQIQTKFRDEPRPRGGLVRVREFAMKDAYSFDADEAGLETSYQKMFRAYQNIYARCGLKAVPVEADSGAIGGKVSHEFMVLAESGEDEIVYCAHCQYGANVEKAAFTKPSFQNEAPLPIEEVATPGAHTIPEVARFLDVPQHQTLKAVFYSIDGEMVFVVIRGDLEVNEVKLRNALKATELRLATEAEVQAAGLVAGAASPVGLSGIRTIADDSISLGANFVAGANKPETHLKNVNYPRDFQPVLILDIARARAGDACPQCGSALHSARGIEVGHVFKLGTVFTERLGVDFLDREGAQKPIVMGCYGIGVGRLLAAAIEQNHDDKGIIWPPTIAPYQIYLCGLSMDDPQVAETAEKAYQEFQGQGLEVLYDDRLESPGVKFNDADLLGLPLRITISPRTLKSRSAELKWRAAKDTWLVPLDQVIAETKRLITDAGSSSQPESPEHKA